MAVKSVSVVTAPSVGRGNQRWFVQAARTPLARKRVDQMTSRRTLFRSQTTDHAGCLWVARFQPRLGRILSRGT